MKPLFTLLLILATFSNINGGYSIVEFLKYLQETGIYELLAEIKHYLGEDISISFCKDLFNSNDCETIVKIYMPAGSRRASPVEPKTLIQIVNEYSNILIAAGFNPFLMKKKLIKLQLNDEEIPTK